MGIVNILTALARSSHYVWGICDGDLLVVLAILFVTGHLSGPLKFTTDFYYPS
jgi:hypothetical protein